MSKPGETIMSFPPDVAKNLLVKSARCCCLCHQFKGTKIELHHIKPKSERGTDTEENGIALCFDCHSDVQSYNDEHPKGRKIKQDELIQHRDNWFAMVASGKTVSMSPHSDNEDAALIRFYSQCLDRPAFQDHFRQERSIEAFDQALEDTITAINTGCLMNREGKTLCTAKGKSYLHSADYRKQMDNVVHILRSMRNKYNEKLKSGDIWQSAEAYGQRMYCINNRDLAEWFDDKRLEVLEIINSLCRAEGIPPLYSSYN